MDTLTDRVAMWTLRSFATAVLFAGVSVLVAGVPLFMFPGTPVTKAITSVMFQLSGVFVTAGAAAMYLARARATGLPNERDTASAAETPRVGGWLIALALVLVTLPVWLLLRLQPFLAEWIRVVGVLSTFDLWNTTNANGAGIVLVLLAAVLAPPLFELAALLAFIVAPAVLLPLLFARRRRFPRIYVVCTVLLSALVIASLRGADAALVAGAAAQQFIEASNAGIEDDLQLTAILTRYTSIVGSTAPVLAWALCGYLGWVPAMIVSRRVRTTFASRVDSRDSASTGAFDIEAITRPPRFPG